MNLVVTMGLLLSAAQPETHRVELDHRGARVDVTYRGDTLIEHKQIGMPAPGGRMSTLRCAWQARVSVHREARVAAGHVLTRTVASATPMEGSRPGWCSGQRVAIARDVAARSEDVRAHLLAVAASDRDTLALELDRAQTPARS